MSLTTITFFERFEADILSGKKTITIRNQDEKDFLLNSQVSVATFEQGRWFCDLMIKSVEPIQFKDLSQLHAAQENMTLSELKSVIREIYPQTETLYVISFSLVAN
ncbi:N(4)-acetylcytidine aminohydrolase [Vibrio gallicus]|uniref:N(4)-acetylcytidine aminohydrolase n=1 Tax=Vibrio gallicus TaxID=190897 RepID=UPI0021C2D114|nr:N(4)-acetylcytidine aminohydrolase [Vibrio gallicus]